MDLDLVKKSLKFYRIFCPVLLAVAGASYWTGHAVRAAVLTGLSLCLLVFHLALPERAAAFFKAYSAFMSKAGGWLTRVFMILFFYVIFTPYGLLVRTLQGDVLKRRFDASAGSYWIPKNETDNAAERCERPF